MRCLYLLYTILLIGACQSSPQQQTVKKTSPKQNKTKQWFESIQQNNSSTLFIVIDPHGDALLAKNTFNTICQKYNINLISPYTIKNNKRDFIQQIDRCIQEFPTNKIYLIGFSGGARMAFQYAIQHYKNINGVIMCGAGIGQYIQKPLPFPLVMVSGLKDFNLLEQYYSPYQDIVFNKNIITLFFNGQHEWPDSTSLEKASIFVLSKNNTEQYSINNKKKETDILFKFKDLELKYKLNPINKKGNIHSIKQARNKANFKTYIQHFEKTLSTEAQRNQILLKELPIKDWGYWKQTIREIEKHILNTNKVLESQSYYRTKAFLGLVIYSLCSKEIQNPQSLLIHKYLKIYETLEPENVEMLKMKTIIQH